MSSELTEPFTVASVAILQDVQLLPLEHLLLSIKRKSSQTTLTPTHIFKGIATVKHPEEDTTQDPALRRSGHSFCVGYLITSLQAPQRGAF